MQPTESSRWPTGTAQTAPPVLPPAQNRGPRSPGLKIPAHERGQELQGVVLWALGWAAPARHSR